MAVCIKNGEILNIRLLERRNSSISGLLRLFSTSSPVKLSLDHPTKNELLKKACDLYVAAGMFVTKLRSSLKEETIVALTFPRKIWKKNDS